MTIEENVALAPFTTFKLGGRARYFARAASLDDIREGFAFARDNALALLVLGGGSNMLIGDGGWDGLALKLQLRGIARENDTLIAAAGENWDELVSFAIERGLWGIENLSGVPGTVGGAVVQNIGAYGAALSETVAWVEALDTETNGIVRLLPEECGFDYRDSIFKHSMRYIVTRAACALRTEGAPNLAYKDLAEMFGAKRPSLAQIREGVLAIRRDKFPDLNLEGTAGSFFKNPIVDAETGKKLAERYPGMPLFPMPETSGVKIPLAWLLDKRLGLKGLRVGGARLYERQPLVIVAARTSSARDVESLAHEVMRRVKESCGIEIEPEVRIISSNDPRIMIQDSRSNSRTS